MVNEDSVINIKINLSSLEVYSLQCTDRFYVPVQGNNIIISSI